MRAPDRPATTPAIPPRAAQPGAAAPLPTLVLGVDGGGTRTVAWLAAQEAAAEARPLGRGEAGPGNPRAVGYDAAQSSIAAAIQRAFDDARIPPAPVAAVCLGLSGAGRAEEQQRVKEWALQVGIARQVTVTHDAEIILAAASADATGIALIAGTGSLAWGRNAAGETERTGGWGYLLGDEGSAYWMALAGLRAAARAADGRGPWTHLLPRLLERLELATPEELIGKVYGTPLNREEIAGLAGVIVAASDNDGAAAEIVTGAADELARMTSTLARKLRFADEQYTLAVAGGVLANSELIRNLLEEELRVEALSPQRLEVVREPVVGAVVLARRRAAAAAVE